MFELLHSKPLAYFGRGAIGNVDKLAEEIEGKLLVVTTRSAYKRSGAWDAVKRALEGREIEYELYDKVRANPTYENCGEATQIGIDIGADWVMGIGGGSAIDTAKIVSVLIKHPGKKAKDLLEDGFEVNDACQKIAINLTHGTGTEVDKFAVSQSDKEYKIGIGLNAFYPDYTIDDPDLTKTLSKEQTIATSIDAMNHAFEAATNANQNPYSILLAKEAIALIAKNLRATIDDPLNSELRERLLFASAIAGMSFDITGTHITHVLEHAISAIKPEIAHGTGLAVFLPAVVEVVYPAMPELVSELLAPVVKLQGKKDEVSKARAGVKEWLESFGINTHLGDYGFSSEDRREIEDRALSRFFERQLEGSPIKVDRALIGRIIEESF
ncbi:MAG: iron-containing alcohol dehydrogenase [Candidatus Thermoplasmatota archaeon]|nr:iron-containing alcohol dehydrogenase [Candidatus Thermoplasmatota archaeon]